MAFVPHAHRQSDVPWLGDQILAIVLASKARRNDKQTAHGERPSIQRNRANGFGMKQQEANNCFERNHDFDSPLTTDREKEFAKIDLRTFARFVAAEPEKT